MKNIWRIYASDWIHIAKVPVGLLLMIALALLPSVYSWVNLYSVWDPYANTSGIAVAVTSEDEGARVNDLDINIGHDVIESLKSNHKLGWTFVDSAEARQGVERGDYYASLLIPADFSQKITSIVTGHIEKPIIEYTVNEKINAVAPKITSSGASALTAQINENFIRTVSETALKRLKEAGVEIESGLPTIRKAEHAILALEQSLPDIERMGQKVLDFDSRLPELHEKAQKVALLEDNIPLLEQAGDVILNLEEHWPLVNEAAGQVIRLQEKLPDIQQAANHFASIVQNFSKAEEVVSGAIDRTQQAGQIVNRAQQALPKVDQLITSGEHFSEQLQQFMEQHEGAFELLPVIVKENLLLLQHTARSIEEVTQMLMDVNLDPAKALPLFIFAQERLTTGAAVAGHTSDLLQRVNALAPNDVLTSLTGKLAQLQTNMTHQADVLQKLISALERGETPVKDLIEQLNGLSGQADQTLSSILSRYDSEIVPAFKQALDRMKASLVTASAVMSTIHDQLGNISGILGDASAGIAYGLERLTALQQELPAIRGKLEQLSSGIDEKLKQFTTVVNTAAPFLQNELPGVEQKVRRAADFARNDLPRVEEEIHRLSDFVQNKLPELEHLFGMTADFVRDDLPALEDAVRKAANKIRELQAEEQLAELARLLRGDIAKESEFLAAPVHIHENRLYAVPNYGSAMAPFYGVLAIWVGSTLLISLLKTEVETGEARYRPYELFIGRWLTFLTIGMSQALIMALGNIFLLKIYAVHPVWFVLFAVMISVTFVTITYTLLSVFGNVGKGIAIIFMVLQFTSSGGTFPVSTTAHIFQVLNPFMPFTYAISLLREAVAGIWLAAVIRDVIALLCFIGISFIVALVLKKPLSGFTRRSAEKARKTKIIS